jgi:hypothetical protein
VWFIGSGTSWGVTFQALQLLVTEKPNKMSEFAFVSEDGEDDAPVSSEPMFESD